MGLSNNGLDKKIMNIPAESYLEKKISILELDHIQESYHKNWIHAEKATNPKKKCKFEEISIELHELECKNKKEKLTKWYFER